MRVAFPLAQLIASLNEATTGRRRARRRTAFRKGKRYAAAATALVLCSTMILPGIALGVPQAVKKVAVTATPAIPKTTTAAAPTAATQKKALPPVQVKPAPAPAPPSSGGVGSVYYPTSQTIETARPVNFSALAKQEALEPSHDVPTEIKSINAPKGDKPEHHRAINAPNSGATSVGEEPSPNTPPPSATGPSPG